MLIHNNIDFKVGKLVRDGLPQIIENEGGTLDYKILNKTEYFNALKLKLIEESKEVFESDDDQILSEMADVLEVFESILALLSVEMKEVIAIKLRKRDERGGFDKRIYCNKISVLKNNKKRLEYYRNRPIEYPEIN